MINRIDIVYEDPQLLVVNKPAGFPVHGTYDSTREHVQGILERQLNQKLVLFHRLDADTTGLLALGRDPSINKQMTDIFRDREVRKIYWAVVDGRWPEETSDITTFIDKVGGKWANVPKGRGAPTARTLFRTLKTNGDRTWLEAELMTGRTHQIRLHCQSMKHSVLGDPLYGRRDLKGVPMALHARTLEFKHPTTGVMLKLEAPTPDYWDDYWLKGLK